MENRKKRCPNRKIKKTKTSPCTSHLIQHIKAILVSKKRCNRLLIHHKEALTAFSIKVPIQLTQSPIKLATQQITLTSPPHRQIKDQDPHLKNRRRWEKIVQPNQPNNLALNQCNQILESDQIIEWRTKYIYHLWSKWEIRKTEIVNWIEGKNGKLES